MSKHKNKNNSDDNPMKDIYNTIRGELKRTPPDKKHLKEAVEDMSREHRASIVLELRRGSPDYKLITSILAVDDQDICNNVSIFCVESRPGPKSLHEFLFKPKSHSALFKWLTNIGGSVGRPYEADNLAADLIFHMYGYNCWGSGRSDWSIFSN